MYAMMSGSPIVAADLECITVLRESGYWTPAALVTARARLAALVVAYGDALAIARAHQNTEFDYHHALRILTLAGETLAGETASGEVADWFAAQTPDEATVKAAGDVSSTFTETLLALAEYVVRVRPILERATCEMADLEAGNA